MTHTNSISFDLAWYKILSQYSAAVRRTVCDAVLNFALTGEIPVLKGIAKMAFQFISHEISKQLGTVPVATIPMAVATPDETPMQSNDNKEMAETQQPETLPEVEPTELQQSVAEADTGMQENTLSNNIISGTAIPEPEKETGGEVEPPQEKEDTAPQIARTNPPARQARHAVPASPGHKKQDCITSNRTTAGKITCTRKGSKILFRRR